MANTHTWLYALILYFIGLIAVTTLLAGAALDTDYNVAGTSNMYSELDQTINQTSVADESNIDIKDTFKFVWSFFGWNVYFSEGDTIIKFLWLFRLLFVYLPLLALVAVIYYSLPFAGGH